MVLLGGSRLRKKLLAYVFAHPGESYHVRGLAEYINADPGNMSRELNALLQEGLFKSSRKGNLKLYGLNQKYPLYNELRAIISKTEGLEGDLRELIRRFSGITLAFIYGSYARNKENRLSDVDLVIVGKTPHKKISVEMQKMEKKYDRELNFTNYSEIEFENERQKRDGFLDLVLKDKIIILKGSLYV